MDLLGQHLVVTAGGTREPIDPIRFILNDDMAPWRAR
jgi:phosphopantothenoylcysteine synthetase/decarboxylase